MGPGRVAQSVGHLTRKSGVLGSIPGLHGGESRDLNDRVHGILCRHSDETS